MPLKSFGTVFNSPSIVTMAVSVAVCELFSVKGCNLANWVTGRSRSLKMAPFDRPYVTFYWTAIVTTALSCTIFELFDVELYHEFEIWFKRSLKVIDSGTIRKLGCNFLLPSIVTMAV